LVTNILLTQNFATPPRGFCLYFVKQKHRSGSQKLKIKSNFNFLNVFVPPAGIEPTSPVPKTDTLSIKLRGQARNKSELASDLISSAAPAKRSLSGGNYFSLCGYRESNPNPVLGKDVFYH
jgi:hypothetical protein